jgi:hypothetical protein
MQSTYRSLMLLSLIIIPLISYNFLSAAWTAPAGAPPTANTESPINTGSLAQVKLGALGTGALSVTGNLLVTGSAATFYQVRADSYCNRDGTVCRTMEEIVAGLGGSAPTAPQLVNGRHTESECLSYGGSIQTDGADKFCRITAASCPLGWSQFKSWDERPATAQDPCSYGYNSCTAPAQNWSNVTAVPTGSVWCGTNADTNHSSTQYCSSLPIRVGCY